MVCNILSNNNTTAFFQITYVNLVIIDGSKKDEQRCVAHPDLKTDSHTGTKSAYCMYSSRINISWYVCLTNLSLPICKIVEIISPHSITSIIYNSLECTLSISVNQLYEI